MVGHIPLEDVILVRVQVSQPICVILHTLSTARGYGFKILHRYNKGMVFGDSKNNLVISIAVVLAVAALGLILLWKLPKSPAVPIPEGSENAIVIKDVEISENNFTGIMPRIEGGGELAAEARKFIEDFIYDFKMTAGP